MTQSGSGSGSKTKAPKVEVGRWDERDPRQSAPSEASTPLGRLEFLAWVLDSSIPVPGTSFRVGVESLIGLIPGIGDAIGVALSSFILIMAARMGVPRVTLLRMGFNVALEGLVGIVPIAGDLFDFAWKANRRNVELLRAHVEHPVRARKVDWIFATVFLLGIAALLGLLAWGGFLLGRAVLRLFTP